eukprot:g73005.t1
MDAMDQESLDLNPFAAIDAYVGDDGLSGGDLLDGFGRSTEDLLGLGSKDDGSLSFNFPPAQTPGPSQGFGSDTRLQTAFGTGFGSEFGEQTMDTDVAPPPFLDPSSMLQSSSSSFGVQPKQYPSPPSSSSSVLSSSSTSSSSSVYSLPPVQNPLSPTSATQAAAATSAAANSFAFSSTGRDVPLPEPSPTSQEPTGFGRVKTEVYPPSDSGVAVTPISASTLRFGSGTSSAGRTASNGFNGASGPVGGASSPVAGGGMNRPPSRSQSDGTLGAVSGGGLVSEALLMNQAGGGGGGFGSSGSGEHSPGGSRAKHVALRLAHHAQPTKAQTQADHNRERKQARDLEDSLDAYQPGSPSLAKRTLATRQRERFMKQETTAAAGQAPSPVDQQNKGLESSSGSPTMRRLTLNLDKSLHMRGHDSDSVLSHEDDDSDFAPNFDTSNMTEPEARRMKHNEAEKRRRNKIKDTFTELAQLVDCNRTQKSVILRRSIDRVHHLQERVKVLTEENKKLRAERVLPAEGLPQLAELAVSKTAKLERSLSNSIDSVGSLDASPTMGTTGGLAALAMQVEAQDPVKKVQQESYHRTPPTPTTSGIWMNHGNTAPAIPVIETPSPDHPPPKLNHGFMFLSSQVPLLLLNTSGKVIDCNFHFARLLGHTRKDLISQSFFHLTHSEALPASFSVISSVLTKPREVHVVNLVLVQREGNLCPVHITCWGAAHKKTGKVQFISATVEPDNPLP